MLGYKREMQNVELQSIYRVGVDPKLGRVYSLYIMVLPHPYYNDNRSIKNNYLHKKCLWKNANILIHNNKKKSCEMYQ